MRAFRPALELFVYRFQPCLNTGGGGEVVVGFALERVARADFDGGDEYG